ncbi:protealysin inhibitor emfourin [Pseudomonas sp. Pseusp122]|uniref:protealysin inhibitor emfourin n=1 Tax=unclassified Pseudomonas TaxID=196821 RepID=UPI0039A72EA4
MQISIFQSGGVAYFPGLSKPRTLDVESLSDADQQELRQLVEASGFFHLSGDSPSGHLAPNCLSYTLSISEEGRQHTVCLTEPGKAGPLENLLHCVRRHVDQ